MVQSTLKVAESIRSVIELYEFVGAVTILNQEKIIVEIYSSTVPEGTIPRPAQVDVQTGVGTFLSLTKSLNPELEIEIKWPGHDSRPVLPLR